MAIPPPTFSVVPHVAVGLFVNSIRRVGSITRCRPTPIDTPALPLRGTLADEPLDTRTAGPPAGLRILPRLSPLVPAEAIASLALPIIGRVVPVETSLHRAVPGWELGLGGRILVVALGEMAL